VPGVTISASPAWQTASSLADQYDAVAISLQLLATDATSYSITSGSLPPGLTMNSSGLISGTVTTVTVDTTYTFTVVATDAQLQDSPRTFTVTITVSDPYFKLTTLLLTGNSGNNIVTDASTNNFPITVVGDSRASSFSPYLTGWSNYFDGTGDYLDIPTNAAFDFGTGDFTIECWAYLTSSVAYAGIITSMNVAGANPSWLLGFTNTADQLAFCPSYFDAAVTFSYTGYYNKWTHIAVTRSGTTLRLFANGILVSSATNSTTISTGGKSIRIGTRYQNDPQYLIVGYLSNLHVVKGTALYTANFTPATTTLTAVAGTSLLTCHANRLVDSSTNNFAITKSGDVRVESFNPFGLINSGTTGSMYFDGTGDYLMVTNATALQLGTGDFEISGWFYVSSLAATVILDGRAAATAVSYTLGFNSSGYPYIYDGSVAPTGSSGITAGQWNYVVWTRVSGTLRMFVNGTSVYSASSNLSLTGGGSNITICSIVSNSGQSLNGYMSDLRIIKGSGITTSTVPTVPLTAVTNTQLLTLQNRQPHNNHTFQDSSTNNHLITRNGNATQGSFSPFSQSGWSTLFNGSNGLSVPSNTALSFSGEFTFETFVYYNAIPSSGGAASFIMRRSNTASGSSFQFGLNNTSGQFKYFITISVGSTDYDTNWNISAPSVARWYHVAIVRDNASNMHCWLDGVKLTLSGATSNIPGTTNVPSTDVSIGWRNYYNDLYLNGYLSNLRLSAAALYSGSTFTVPAQAFDPSQANTRLLICHTRRFVDQGSANLTIGFNNSPSIQAFSPFAPTAVYSPAIHGGSAYFDGSGDYAWCTTNVAKRFEPGSGFTFECWYYDVSGSTAGPAIFEICGSTLNWNASTGVHIQLNTNSGGNQYFQWSKGDGFTTTYYWTAPAHGQWNHFAACYNGTTTSGWLNGNRVFTSTTGWPVPSYDRFSLGGNNVTPGSYANIYLSNLRWVSGTALYNVASQTITIPTGPFTSTANSILLLNFTNDAIEDATGRNVIETVADARTTSAVSKWTGKTSMLFDGTGDYTILPATQTPFFLISGLNWTAECWYYKLSSALKTLLTCGPANAGGINRGWSFGLDPANSIVYFGSSGADNTFNSVTIPINSWNHIAFVYTVSDTTMRVYINGNLVGTKANPVLSNPSVASGDRFIVGATYAGASNWDGYIADLRWTTGHARYTSNFTPPTASPRLK